MIPLSIAPPRRRCRRESADQCLYAYPLGLQSGVTIDIQLSVPPGNIYPIEQTQTLACAPTAHG
ncbi:hypothetical protein J4732_15905 [Serratia marcescens]|uniref:Uncharacterized protein n=1 Tax=Serratia marcescens TaxID=615 RepID=A0A939NPE6_SERMA|nr:hypothetical protein [Serratia marcescens]